MEVGISFLLDTIVHQISGGCRKASGQAVIARSGIGLEPRPLSVESLAPAHGFISGRTQGSRTLGNAIVISEARKSCASGIRLLHCSAGRSVERPDTASAHPLLFPASDRFPPSRDIASRNCGFWLSQPPQDGDRAGTVPALQKIESQRISVLWILRLYAAGSTQLADGRVQFSKLCSRHSQVIGRYKPIRDRVRQLSADVSPLPPTVPFLQTAGPDSNAPPGFSAAIQ